MKRKLKNVIWEVVEVIAFICLLLTPIFPIWLKVILSLFLIYVLYRLSKKLNKED